MVLITKKVKVTRITSQVMGKVILINFCTPPAPSRSATSYKHCTCQNKKYGIAEACPKRGVVKHSFIVFEADKFHVC